MVSYVFPVNAIAFGDSSPGTGGNPGTITPEGFPIAEFLLTHGGDPNVARVIMTVPGTAADHEDGLPQSTAVVLQIDADGDGDPDYEIKTASGNPESNLYVSNSISGNVGFFQGDYGIYPMGSDEPLVEGNVRFYLTTEPGGFTIGEDLQIEPTRPPVLNLDDVTVLPCFTRGTRIDTPDGPRLIEELAVGDLVLTRDHGPQPIRWIASRRVGARALARQPNLQPIRIAAGAFGAGLPETDLLVSPQHRVLIASRVVRHMFGTDEVLVPAKKLLDHPGVTQDSAESVEYFHILLDRHEIVCANGAWSETLLTGPMALKALGPEACREIALLFPEMASPSYVAPPARRLVEPRRAGQMIRRHLANGRDLYEPEAGQG